MSHGPITENLPHAHSRTLGLDLLRALAIVLVLLSHWANNILHWFDIHPPWWFFYIGEIGVDMFFALSGFLIGRILIEQAGRDPSARNLWVFLVRRWMRTLPLYFLCLALLAILLPPKDDLVGHIIQYGTMTQNLLQPMPGDWWFSVTWSLSIEEWFYVLFGGAVFLAMGLVRAKWAIWIPVVGFLAFPLALRLLVPGFSDPQLGMAKIVPFRLDDIAYGVIAALLFARGSWVYRRPRACLAVGLAMVAIAWLQWIPLPLRLEAAFRHNVVIIGCALLLPAAMTLRSLPRVATTAITGISAQAYGLYLVHETILVDVAQRLWWVEKFDVWWCVAIAIVTPFVLSYLSFRYFESPILKMRPKHSARFVWIPVVDERR